MVAFLIASSRSRGWKVSSFTRIGCEILMTVDGFGAARLEKCAQSQGFGMHGPGRGGGGGGRGVGEPRTGIIYGPRVFFTTMHELSTTL